MEEKGKPLANGCSFMGVKPIMVDLPYPPVQVMARNPAYANLLSFDYCGSVSELSAIAQYINHENRMSAEQCPLARTILGIAIAEMIHLQKLGELIFLLGGSVEFSVKQQNGRQKPWTSEYIAMSGEIKQMLYADIEAEKGAIHQYRVHRKMINDQNINKILERIIMDEEYHIMILQALMKEW